MIIPDDTATGLFKRALLRVETQEPCTHLEIGVWLNDKRLQPCEHADAELFPPVEMNAAYAAPDALKFYEAPLDAFVPGANRVAIRNLGEGSCRLFSMEIALYR